MTRKYLLSFSGGPGTALSIGSTEINKMTRPPHPHSRLPYMKTDLQQGVNDKLAECYGGEGVGGLVTAQLEGLPRKAMEVSSNLLSRAHGHVS